MKRAVAIALLLSLPAFAEEATAPVVQVESARLVTKDSGILDVGAGLYLREDAAVAVARELKAAQAERDALKEHLKNSPNPSIHPAVLVVGGVLLFGAGAFACAKACPSLFPQK